MIFSKNQDRFIKFVIFILNRVEDLGELERLTGNDKFLEGKICIARYGKIFRGNKVHNCQNKGAIGK